MSSFNNITKIKYNQNQSDPVSLCEYVLCSDTNNKKVVVFKFKNNLNQQLSEIKFEVFQYDENNDLIEKVVVSHDNFKTPEGEFFIPNAKLRVLDNCVSIKTVLLYAKFERVEWSNNEFTELTYTKYEFRNDYKKVKNSNKISKPTIKSRFLNKVEVLGEKQQAERLYRGLTRKKGFSATSTYNATRSKVAFWFTLAFSILLVLYVGVSAGIYKFTSKVIFDGTFDYTILSNTEVSITDYEGKEKDVTIPMYFREYKIVSIGEEAFENSYITSITFTSEITIEDKAFKGSSLLTTFNNADLVKSIGYNAFEGCSSLKEVEFSNASTVKAYAFKNCKSLSKVSLPLATLEIGTFIGCKSLKSLTINDTYQNSFQTLFNEEGKESTPSVQYLHISRKYIDSGYFDNCSNLTQIEFPTDTLPMFGFGGLSGANLDKRFYDSNETCEVYYGEIVSFNSESTKLIIPNSITRIENSLKFIKSIANSITDLTIEYKGSDIDLNSSFLSQFRNLEKLTLDEGVTVSSDFLYSSNLKEISLYAGYFYNISLPSRCTKLNILGDGNTTSTWINNIGNIGNITDLFVEKTVYVGTSSFRTLTGLQHLTVYNTSKPLNYMGISTFISSLDILLDEKNTEIADSFASGYNNLRTINIPEGITYIGKEFIKNNTTITSFTLPTTVKQVGLPLIGSGCTNLRDVTTHLLGSSAISNSSYYAFNASSPYTVSLNITAENVKLIDTFSNNCGMMKNLTIKNVVDAEYGCFSGLTSIENIKLKIDEFDSIGYLFASKNYDIGLKSLNIETSKLENTDFSGATISKLIVTGACEIESNLLANVSIDGIYFTNSSSFGENVDYYEFFEAYNGYVYLEGDFEYSALGYEERIFANVPLDVFMSR